MLTGDWSESAVSSTRWQGVGQELSVARCMLTITCPGGLSGACSLQVYGRYRRCIELNCTLNRQEAQLSPSDRAMRLVSSNLADYHATVQKLLIRQVLTKPMV